MDTGLWERVFAASLGGGLFLSVFMGIAGVKLGRMHLLTRLLPRRLARVRFRRRGGGQGTGSVVPAMLPLLAGQFAAGFGAIGLVLIAVDKTSGWVSVVGGTVAGSVLAGAWSLILGRYLPAGEAREMAGEPIIGRTGHLSVAAPAGGMGAVAYVAEGKRVTLPARTLDGAALPRRARVMIVEMEGKVAVVQELR